MQITVQQQVNITEDIRTSGSVPPQGGDGSVGPVVIAVVITR